jgi:hypothetical protein
VFVVPLAGAVGRERSGAELEFKFEELSPLLGYSARALAIDNSDMWADARR